MAIRYDCFQDKICLVTGGCSGIGLAVVKKFAEYGGKPVIIDCDATCGKNTLGYFKSISTEVAFIKADVSVEAEVKKAMKDIDDMYGRLDYAYNNAGVGGEFAKVEDYTVSDWNRVIEVNLTGIFLCMKYQIPLMMKSKNPAIVNCASVLSTVAYDMDSAYVASKFGVLGLTKNAALEYASTRLRINSISPGFTNTPMINADEKNEEKLQLLAKKHPIGRIAEPDEIADAVLWLCSTSASFAVGMNLLIDGGYTLQ